MRKIRVVSAVLLLVLLVAACAPQASPAPPAAPAPAPASVAAPAPAAAVPAAPARAAWEEKWEKTLAEAKKEGKVMISTYAGPAARTAMVQDFSKAYGISVEGVGARPGDFSPKILAERRAGLYLWDVHTGGTTSPLTDFKPAGALDPLETAFILPDVTNPEVIKKVWYRGELWWVDGDRMELSFLMFPHPPFAINTNLIKPDEIKSYNDLLDPKWKGKMSFNDPTQAGTTLQSFLIYTFGADWLRKLAKNEPIIMRDARLQVEWLAHGKAPIALGVKADIYMEFKRLGVPVLAITPAEGTWLSAGSGAMVMFNKPAHPNAAKVFINWLLSKEGQLSFARAYGGQSLREDVPTDFLTAEEIRQPGVKYWEKEREAPNFQKAEDMKLAKEIFGFLMK